MPRSDTMQCLWLEGGALDLRTIATPAPLEGEALVRVRLAGICGTDLALRQGYLPFVGVPGHELVGEILEAPGAPERVGERVVGEINAACGVCPACVAGRGRHCPQRTVLGILGRHGAFAEHLTLPLGNLHPVPAKVPDEVAVFTEPVAACLEVLEQVHLQPSDRVLLLGAGRLGQLLAQTLALTGCDLLVVAKHPGQRRMLTARGIPTLAPDASLPPAAFDVVVEATGNPAGFGLARGAVRPGGTLVLKSTYPGQAPVELSSLVVDEITLVGSRCGPFQPALRLLGAGHVDPLPLVAGTYPLDKALEAFARAEEPGVFKVLLRP